MTDTASPSVQQAALDRITALEAENKALRDVLEPFIRSLGMQESEAFVCNHLEPEDHYWLKYAMVGDARRARALLAKEPIS